MRTLILSKEYTTYFEALPNNVQKKYVYALNILRNMPVLNAKFVKKLNDCDFYELRISVGTNEYRSILLAIDNDNINNATQILVLNSFLKKNNSDYKVQIEKANSIIKNLEQ